MVQAAPVVPFFKDMCFLAWFCLFFTDASACKSDPTLAMALPLPCPSSHLSPRCLVTQKRKRRRNGRCGTKSLPSQSHGVPSCCHNIPAPTSEPAPIQTGSICRVCICICTARIRSRLHRCPAGTLRMAGRRRRGSVFVRSDAELRPS